jgi:ATP/maltotriose-dependent transcriptional regulator MalT
VGREREQQQLHALLEAALTGHGSLVLVSGEAGIGKTSLIRQVSAGATERGFLVLTGACYDTGVHTSYEPWHEVSNRVAHDDRLRAVLPGDNAWIEEAANATAIRTRLRDMINALASHMPLLLILEDIHWADSESLEFLRFFARNVYEQPLVLIVTYRDTDLAFNQALNLILPALIRESNAERIALRALDEDAIATLVQRRYDLPAHERTRLTAHLARRSQGVPFYILELLRTLEDESRLDQTASGWRLGELDGNHVPLLVKQMLATRLNRFGEDVLALLELASVIGQDVSLMHLQCLSRLDNDAFADLLERALQSHVLDDDSSSMELRFTHALVRDSLYNETPRHLRQRWHRQFAELLVEDGREQPAIIAHHFRAALDPRATHWFIRAGAETEFIARLTAAEHFAAALEMMGNEATVDRGWLLTRYARTIRGVQPHRSLALLATAGALAEQADDRPLLAYLTYSRGQIRGLVGDTAGAIGDLRRSVEILGGLSSDEQGRLAQYERDGYHAGRAEIEGYLAALLAIAGHLEEAQARCSALLEQPEDSTMYLWISMATTAALTGHPRDALDAFVASRRSLGVVDASPSLLIIALYQLWMYQLPYAADRLDERRQFARDAERNVERTSGSYGEISPRLTSLPWLFLEGDWSEARDVARSTIETTSPTSIQQLIAAVFLAKLSRAQGDHAFAWQLVQRAIPTGSQTHPGDADLEPTLEMMRIAIELCLDNGELARAQARLSTLDHWLDWSGATLGRAESHLLWAHLYRALNDLPRALEEAKRALVRAEAPRQPLILVAIQRTLGQLTALAGRFEEARRHLDTALSLADACAAIYERALTLLERANVEQRAGEPGAALEALNTARPIFSRLGAAPALVRTDALTTQLVDRRGVRAGTEFSLTARELDVLRLIAHGSRNRAIADELFLSVRTVERHITNLYAKIGVTSRSEAVAFALAHDIR